MPKSQQPRRAKPDALPWRRVKFVKARKQAGLAGGGKIFAEVRLPGPKHWVGDPVQTYEAAMKAVLGPDESWCHIAIEMDGEGFRRLAALDDRARYLLLSTLATVPVRCGLLTGKKRPRGKNTAAVRMAWYTAAWLDALFADWLADPSTIGGALCRRVLKAMKKAGRLNDGGISAFLVSHNWNNAHKLNPTRFPQWDGADNPARFSKAIARYRRGKGRRSPAHAPATDTLISGILCPRPTAADVYVLDANPRFGLTDFQIA